jgi:hypothetical protein
MSWRDKIWGKRPTADDQIRGINEREQAKQAAGNFLARLRGRPRPPQQQKMCPNGHYSPIGAARCPYCGFSW